MEMLKINAAKSIVQSSGCDENAEQQFDIYKLFWIFTLGSILGVVVETIFCLVIYGRLEWRSSIMFAPFNIVYGIGALVLYLTFYKIEKDRYVTIFIMGAAAGTVVEYACSWVQEAVFGTVSWDYTNVFLNVGGRVCLFLTVCWGLLSILWVKTLLPKFEKAIENIPNFMGRKASKYLFVFLVVSTVISALAVARWSVRIDGVPAINVVDQAVDYLFPNNIMETLYSSMKFL